MSDQFLRVFESFKDQSPLTLLVTLFVVVLSLIVFWVLRRRPASKKNVLLLGTSNSGKTRIFCQLVYKTNLLTQISITSNSGVALIEKSQKSKEKSIDLVDIPGQDKVRRKFFGLYKKTAKAIVFVVDSSTFQRESKDVAQFLFEILTDDVLARSKVKLLVVCNKQDIDMSKGKTFIKANLEKEIELLRKISSSALKSTNTSGDSKTSIEDLFKSQDKAFEFSDLKYSKVDFCEASSLKDENMASLNDWLCSNL